jgi:lysophospholipase L1-like esterase
LKKLFSEKGNPKVKFIGSHAGHGRKPDGSHAAHEGRGGWTWFSYCTRWAEAKDEKKVYKAKSPFLFLKDGKPQLDFQKYLDKYNDGKALDFITVFLGCNDTFGAKDDNIEAQINRMFKCADTLIAEFRKISKDTQIGLLLLVPPAATQDAFGSNYKCGQTRWQYRRNQHRVVERQIEKYENREKENVFLIPAYLNIDCVNNFPKKTEALNSRNDTKISRDCNGVHPAKEGYLQIADSVYAWLKYRLNQTK